MSLLAKCGMTSTRKWCVLMCAFKQSWHELGAEQTTFSSLPLAPLCVSCEGYSNRDNRKIWSEPARMKKHLFSWGQEVSLTWCSRALHLIQYFHSMSHFFVAICQRYSKLSTKRCALHALWCLCFHELTPKSEGEQWCHCLCLWLFMLAKHLMSHQVVGRLQRINIFESAWFKMAAVTNWL